MRYKKIHEDLQKILSKKRYIHSCGVSGIAKKLAERYGGNTEKAELAGLVHDCAKELSLEVMEAIAEKHELACDDYVRSQKSLFHGPVGSVWIQDRYDIDDEEISQAIYYHTTGRPHMTILEKVVFLADYIEPTRDFLGVESLRKYALKDLDVALLHAYDCTIAHLAKQHAYIYELTLEGRNALLREMSQKDV